MISELTLTDRIIQVTKHLQEAIKGYLIKGHTDQMKAVKQLQQIMQKEHDKAKQRKKSHRTPIVVSSTNLPIITDDEASDDKSVNIENSKNKNNKSKQIEKLANHYKLNHHWQNRKCQNGRRKAHSHH